MPDRVKKLVAETVEDKYGYPVPVDKRVSPEDQKRLRELGWFIDTQTDSWAAYA